MKKWILSVVGIAVILFATGVYAGEGCYDIPKPETLASYPIFSVSLGNKILGYVKQVDYGIYSVQDTGGGVLGSIAANQVGKKVYTPNDSLWGHIEVETMTPFQDTTFQYGWFVPKDSPGQRNYYFALICGGKVTCFAER